MSTIPPATGHADDRRVTWVELFFDLVFVAAVSQVGTPLGSDYSFHGLGRYAFLLLVIWWAWHGYAVFATRFDTDDLPQRTTTFLQMIAVIFMAANAEGGLDSVSSAGFAAAYAVMRLILVGQYLRASRRPHARRLALEYAGGFGVAAAVWLVSSMVPVPWRYGLWGVALTIDLGTARVVSRHTLSLPPHAAHLPERFGLFTLILLGEAIVAVMKGIQSQPDWSLAAASAALSGIALVCVFWWAYFEAASAASHRPVRCQSDYRALELWSYTHLPLYLGLAVTGIGVEHAVTMGGWHTLHGEELWLFGTAVLLAVGSLATLGAASPARAAARAAATHIAA